MIQEIQILLDKYLSWLKEETSLREIGDFVEITTPYLDRHNDYLQIYASASNGGFVLTDDGYVLNDLEQSGCNLDSPKRQALLKTTLNGFGVKCDGEELMVKALPEDFAVSKHNLVQAMLAVSDLFFLASPTVASLFHDDVANWLDDAKIRCTQNVKLPGKSGFDHRFEFVIPKSASQPERVLSVINRPNRTEAQRAVFAWIDIKENRPEDTRAFTFLNDSDGAISESVKEALREYEVTPIPWSTREESKLNLAA